MKIGLFHRNDGNNFRIKQKGGSATYHENFLALCEINNWKTIDLGRNEEHPDLIFFSSLGEFSDTIKSASKRIERVKKENVPAVLFLHGVKEHLFYKESYSIFKDFEFDLIIFSFINDETIRGIQKYFKYKRLLQINLPFVFPENTVNFIKDDKLIVSPSRIDALKRTTWILEIANILGKEFSFSIFGNETGLYWFRAVKASPFYKKELFKGAYSDFTEIYKNSAFAIDLSFHKDSVWKNSWIDRGKLQYTTIEMISQGVIPVVFDSWFVGIEKFYYIGLSDPIIKGNTWIINIPEWVDKIRSAKYDEGKARINIEILKRYYSLEKIAPKYKEIFEEII
jgi:hypothetical protein